MAEAKKYRVVVGCNYPPDDTRAEIGDIIEVPDTIAKELSALGAIVPHRKGAKASEEIPSTPDEPGDGATNTAPTDIEALVEAQAGSGAHNPSSSAEGSGA